jgi:hypothetical protein
LSYSASALLKHSPITGHLLYFHFFSFLICNNFDYMFILKLSYLLLKETRKLKFSS